MIERDVIFHATSGANDVNFDVMATFHDGKLNLRVITTLQTGIAGLKKMEKYRHHYYIVPRLLSLFSSHLISIAI